MEESRSDELFSATTGDGAITVVGAVTTGLVLEIARRHTMTATPAVAVGRLATAATLIGASLKGNERVSLQIHCDGPLQSLAAEVSLIDESSVGIRAHTKHDRIDLPRNAVGDVDVRHAVGSGYLQVTKSFEIGQPFVGIVGLRSGEIDDDVAAYFTQSQQIPAIVALGVHESDGGILNAGGMIAQVMPGADEWVYEDLEVRARAMPDVARQLREGAGAQDLAELLTGGRPLRSQHTYNVRFHCRCTLERVQIALLSLGREDLERLAEEQPVTEAICEFCRRVYELSSAEVRILAAQLPESEPGGEFQA